MIFGNLVFQCGDDFDFAKGMFGQCFYGHTGTSRPGGKVTGVHLIEGVKIIHICDEAVCLDNLVEGGTGSFQHNADIAAGTVSLFFDGVDVQFTV